MKLQKEEKHFLLKSVNVLLIVLALLYYNQGVSYHGIIDSANKRISQLEAAASMKQPQGKAAVSSGKYKDGEYTGSGRGYGGTISVKVTIEKGNIADITVTDSSSEDAEYYNNAVSMLDVMMEQQTAEVDVVAGATYSSNGIKSAVKDALSKAEKNAGGKK